jgi:putative flippase GtrA
LRVLAPASRLAFSLQCPVVVSLLAKFVQLLRAGAAGLIATAVDLGTLALLVSVMHVGARVASVPALLAGGVANFVGNRHFAFRASAGSFARQALGYTVVEVVALALNGALYDIVLRTAPGTVHAYWAVRLVTSHVVFLFWSYPLWRRVFSVRHLGRWPSPQALRV